MISATEHLPENGQPKLEQPIHVEIEMGDDKRVFDIGTVERVAVGSAVDGREQDLDSSLMVSRCRA